MFQECCACGEPISCVVSVVSSWILVQVCVFASWVVWVVSYTLPRVLSLLARGPGAEA